MLTFKTLYIVSSPTHWRLILLTLSSNVLCTNIPTIYVQPLNAAVFVRIHLITIWNTIRIKLKNLIKVACKHLFDCLYPKFSEQSHLTVYFSIHLSYIAYTVTIITLDTPCLSNCIAFTATHCVAKHLIQTTKLNIFTLFTPKPLYPFASLLNTHKPKSTSQFQITIGRIS